MKVQDYKLGLIIGSIVVTAILLVGFAMGIYSKIQTAYGSVNDSSSAYQSTTTRASFDGAAITATGVAPKLLSSGFGSLGSVVITGAGTGVVDLYDATTTGAHSDYAGTTTLAHFPASAAAGTYVFDVEYRRGLILVVTGTVGTSTITWKK